MDIVKRNGDAQPEFQEDLKLQGDVFFVFDGSENHEIIAEIFTNKRLDLNNLKLDPLAKEGCLPLGLMRISRLSKGYLIPFIDLGQPERFPLWRLTEDFKFEKQVQISEVELKLLLRIAYLSPNPKKWAANATKGISTVINSAYDKLSGHAKHFDEKPFKSDLINRGFSRNSIAIDFAFEDLSVPNFAELLEDARLFASNLKFPEEISFEFVESTWLEFCDCALGQDPRDWVVSQYRYEVFREIVAVFLKSDIFFNPLTGQHQIADKSRFCSFSGDRNKVSKFCMSSHEDDFIVELRGSGYTADTFCYQLGEFFMWRPPWSGVTSWPKITVMTRHEEVLNDAANSKEKKPKLALQLNCSSQRNLGHTLWNDLSGLNIVSSNKALKDRVRPVAYNSYQDGFDESGESYYEFAQRAGLFPANAMHFENANAQDSIFEHQRPVIIKSFVFSKEIRRSIQEYSELGAQTDSGLSCPSIKSSEIETSILVNIRSHNKAWTNVVECFDEFLGRAADRQTLCQLRFVLEYGKGGESIATQLLNAMSNYDLEVKQAYKLPISELAILMARIDVAVVPVGSGMVLPTWVWHKKVIAHGDPMHMRQLDWWESVNGNNKCEGLQILAVPKDEIIPETDKFYSNYSIRKKAFADLLDMALL